VRRQHLHLALAVALALLPGRPSSSRAPIGYTTEVVKLIVMTLVQLSHLCASRGVGSAKGLA
jgi:hypothetical protein